MTTRTVCVGLLLGLLPMGTASGEMAKAVVQGTSAESTLTGDVLLTQTKEGLKVSASLAGAPPGLHGFHIHEFGSCAEAGGGAGGHFNPAGRPHGDLLVQRLSGAHAGDLGNIEVGPDGRGSLERAYPGLALSGGRYAVAGRALIVHADPDDFGQPTGNAGGRIGCGAILITGR